MVNNGGASMTDIPYHFDNPAHTERAPDVNTIPAPSDAEQPVEMPALSADEEAAMKFTKLLPFVSKLGSALPSKGGLVRVLHAISEFPLGATKPRLLNEAERQLFQVCMELSGYKSTVITSIMQKNAEAQKEAEALKQSSSTTTETEVRDESNENI